MRAIVRKVEKEEWPKYWPFIEDIETQSFEFTWDDTDWTDFLESRRPECYVALVEGITVGYICLELHYDLISIENLAVLPAVRGIGIGTLLAERAILRLKRGRKRKRVVAAVWEHNLAAQCFFRQAGFRVDMIFEDAYELDGEHAELGRDVYLFEHQLTPYSPVNRISAYYESQDSTH